MPEKRLITPEDLLAFKFIETPKLSPDGKKIAYIMTQMDEEQNGYQSSIYLTELNKEPTPFTTFQVKDKLIRERHPAWSNDGQTLYFLSNRGGTNQVWSISANGGEARQLTQFEEEVTKFVISPTGTYLICQLSVLDPKEDDHEKNEDVTVVTRLRYLSNGTGFITKTQQLAALDLQTSESKRLTDGKTNSHSVSFSPDGNSILFLKSKEDPERKDYFQDLFRMDLKTGQVSLLYAAKGSIHNVKVSPDGSLIAFAGHEGGEISPDNASVWILPFEGGSAKNLTVDYDRPVGNYVGADSSMDPGGDLLQWDADSLGLIFTSTEGGNCLLKHVDLASNVSTLVKTEPGVILSFDRLGDQIAFHYGNPQEIGNLYLWSSSSGEAKKITHHNDSLLNNLDLAEPQAFTYRSADDWGIEGWVLLPPVSTLSNQKIPVVLEIHGGPHTAYGNAFHHEFQLLAAKGYAVVYTNPRGSQGYGRNFTAACVGDWGQKDQQDILKGLDVALERFPTLDRDSLFVTGGSYGGFMTNMIISHTDRFKAAVTQRCISNMYSFFGTSDIGYYFGEKQLGGVDLWDDEETIMKFSPIRYARNVNTPTCILHSEEDYRCPVEQAEQWYVALRRLGVQTRFVRFKGENHELSRSGKPKNRLRRLNEIVQWFENYRN